MAAAAQRGTTVWKLAERSVLPLFVRGDDGHPRRIGSGVLVRLLGQPFIVTAAHVILHIEQVETRLIYLAPEAAN